MNGVDRQRLRLVVDARQRELQGCLSRDEVERRRAAVEARVLARVAAKGRHGTETGYAMGCRCQRCRSGASDARALRRAVNLTGADVSNAALLALDPSRQA